MGKGGPTQRVKEKAKEKWIAEDILVLMKLTNTKNYFKSLRNGSVTSAETSTPITVSHRQRLKRQENPPISRMPCANAKVTSLFKKKKKKKKILDRWAKYANALFEESRKKRVISPWRQFMEERLIKAADPEI